MADLGRKGLEREAAKVFDQATCRAARRLGLSRTGLATGGYLLRPDTAAGQTAAQLIRTFIALDALVGGDAVTRQVWLANWNRQLNGVPRLLLNSDAGLTEFVTYLEAMHAGR